MPCSAHLITSHILWVDFIIDNMSVGHVIKLVFIVFSTVESLFSLLRLISTFVGGTLGLCKYLVP